MILIFIFIVIIIIGLICKKPKKDFYYPVGSLDTNPFVNGPQPLNTLPLPERNK